MSILNIGIVLIMLLLIYGCFSWTCSETLLIELIDLETEHRNRISAKMESMKIIYHDLEYVPPHPSDGPDYPLTSFTIEAEISKLKDYVSEVQKTIEHYQTVLHEISTNISFMPEYDFNERLLDLKSLPRTGSRIAFPHETLNPNYIIKKHPCSYCINGTESFEHDEEIKVERKNIYIGNIIEPSYQSTVIEVKEDSIKQMDMKSDYFELEK